LGARASYLRLAVAQCGWDAEARLTLSEAMVSASAGSLVVRTACWHEATSCYYIHRFCQVPITTGLNVLAEPDMPSEKAVSWGHSSRIGCICDRPRALEPRTARSDGRSGDTASKDKAIGALGMLRAVRHELTSVSYLVVAAGVHSEILGINTRCTKSRVHLRGTSLAMRQNIFSLFRPTTSLRQIP